MMAPPSLDFTLSAENKATRPVELEGRARDDVRLLVSDRDGERDLTFRDLPRALRAGDLLVVNDSATLPAALDATSLDDGRLLALHCSTRLGYALWIVEPRGKVRAGERFILPHDGRVTLLSPLDERGSRLWLARFDVGSDLESYLAGNGRPIAYDYVTERFPLEMYQTIFARSFGSAEMPSAARPFSARVVDALTSWGVEIASVTLHCGVASAEAGESPPMERFAVGARTVRAIERTKAAGGRVIAVGTTAVRALESARDAGGALVPGAGLTELIVDASQRPLADGLLTGFHEPRATHLAMLEAFVRIERIDAAYRHALAAGYRWHEFGDVHLIVPR